MHFQSSLVAKWTNVTRNCQLSEYKDTHEPSAISFIILVLLPVLEILSDRHSDKDFTLNNSLSREKNL